MTATDQGTAAAAAAAPTASAAPTTAAAPTAAAAPAEPAERIDRRALAVARAVLAASWDIGRDPTAQVDRLARSFVRRTVTTTMANPQRVDDRPALLEALTSTEEPTHFSAASVALAAGGIMRRFGPLRVIAKRTPLFAVAAAAPEVWSSVSRVKADVRAVTSYLVSRCRATGVTPDPDRIRRTVVQLLSDEPIDPATEPDHGRLVGTWTRRTLRGLLPFASRAESSRAKRIARRAVDIDPAVLRAADPSLEFG